MAQASSTFSTSYLEEDPAAIAERTERVLCDRVGVTGDCVTHATAHRWRYARGTAPLGEPFLRDPSRSPHVGGDRCNGSRVAVAWTRGTAIANDLLEQLA